MFSSARVLRITALACLAGCASRSVEIISEPSGAEIQTLGGEVLGTTPVTIKEEALEKATSVDGLLSVRLVAAGYLPQTLLVEVRGADSYRLNLMKLDEYFFKRFILRDFTIEHNTMVREMLNIQGLIRTKKYDEADQGLVSFQERFPTIAMSYVMAANVALVRKDRLSARRYLLQAQSLDPTDPVIGRMLGATTDVAGQVSQNNILQDQMPTAADAPAADAAAAPAATGPGPSASPTATSSASPTGDALAEPAAPGGN